MKSHRSTRLLSSGFTLAELLVVTLLLSLLLGALYSFYRSQLFTLRAQEVKLNVKENADVALDLMVRELRMAGARPTVPTAYPPVGCTVPAASTASNCTQPPAPSTQPCPTGSGFERLTVADQKTITFRYDFQGNTSGSAPDGCPDDSNEVITYSYDATDKEIERATGGGSPTPLISDVPSDGLEFKYYAVDGTALTSLPLSFCNRASVSRIEITVKVSASNPDPQISTPIALTLISNVFLPNPRC